MSESNDGGPAFPCRKCGAVIDTPRSWQKRDGRCLPCKRKQQNAINASRPEICRLRAKQGYAFRRAYWVAYHQRRKIEDPTYPIMRAARRKVATELKAGRMLRPSRCESCGVESNVQAHHEDYRKPLDVQWLCKRCHCRADAMLAARANGGAA